jgi:hypothetical protein
MSAHGGQTPLNLKPAASTAKYGKSERKGLFTGLRGSPLGDHPHEQKPMSFRVFRMFRGYIGFFRVNVVSPNKDNSSSVVLRILRFLAAI